MKKQTIKQTKKQSMAVRIDVLRYLVIGLDESLGDVSTYVLHLKINEILRIVDDMEEANNGR
jgi:hypothetical protein